MSEYQYVSFRAIDGPVSEKNLEYMERQSSRAEITPWAFDNEYHFGDFRGNALEMLRRGYDIHLHYANFGVRKLLIRLPHGLPDEAAAKPYFVKDSLQFLRDKLGKGGILSIEPYYDPDDLDEIWEIGDFIDRLAPLRAEILDGDLRPLYLAHLAIGCDGEHDPDEEMEGPVPAGLRELTSAQRALMELYGLSDALIAAAARESPPLALKGDVRSQHAEWLRSQSQATKDAWLAQVMSDPRSTVRMEILAAFRKSRDVSAWPTVRRDRTIAELQAAAVEIEKENRRKETEQAAKQKKKRLAAMKADPEKTLRETEKLVKERSLESYSKISKLLSELRESLAGGEQAGLAEQQAQKLRTANPKRSLLVSALRREGFLPK
jgi:hypothetical protein